MSRNNFLIVIYILSFLCRLSQDMWTKKGTLKVTGYTAGVWVATAPRRGGGKEPQARCPLPPLPYMAPGSLINGLKRREHPPHKQEESICRVLMAS